jgi:hypothetical protein
MTQDSVTVERHIGEQTVLGGTHVDRFTPADSAMGQEVQSDYGIPVFHRDIFGWFGPPDQGPHACQKFALDDGFNQIFVGAELKPSYSIFGVTHRGEGHHMGLGDLADTAYQLEAVHGRHTDIGNRQLGPEINELLQPVPSVGGGADIVPIVFQPTVDQGQEIGFIVNDQQLYFSHETAVAMGRLPKHGGITRQTACLNLSSTYA